MVAKAEVMVEVEVVEVEVMVEVEALHMVSCLQPNFGFALCLWLLKFHIPDFLSFCNIIRTNILICFKKSHPIQKSAGFPR